MNYNDTYKNLLEQVEKRFQEFIPNFEPKPLYEPFSYIMAGGGKRIRPILTMFACAAIGKEPLYALDAAMAIEIMHNFTLVHDDIMDNSPIRRGRETIHVKWDEPVAILSGDVMVGYSYRALNKSIHNPNYPLMVEALSTSLIEVCEGQAYDMQFNAKKDVSIDDYLLMISKKTSALLQACALLGGLTAEADNHQLKVLNDYAYGLGIAFQIQDDVLDITADQAKLGKKIGQDIIEGKKTFIILKTKQLATDKNDIELINKFFANNGLSAEYVPKLKAIMHKLGIFEIAQNEIEAHLKNAQLALSHLKQNDYTDMLSNLLNSLNNRSF
jgi:geranylgeranyl diphosphate synthase, type II